MKRNDTSLLVVIAVSLMFIGNIARENLAQERRTRGLAPQDQPATPVHSGLPLHEAKYWKAVHE